MNINPKELQKFHDLWAPMIASLPAVINAVETAAEMERHVAILSAQRDQAVAEATASKNDASEVILKARAELKDIAAEKSELTKSVKVHGKACEERIKEAEANVSAQAALNADKVKALVAETAAVAETLASRIAQANADYAEVLATKLAEVKDLESRGAKAQESLDKLRAKLG